MELTENTPAHRRTRTIVASGVIVAGALFGVTALAVSGGAPAAGHHIDGGCDGLTVTDTPLVTQDGQTVIAPVGFTSWADLGATSVTGWQKGGLEGPKFASQPEGCEQETTTTEAEETTTTVEETTTTEPEATTTTTLTEVTTTVVEDTTTTTEAEVTTTTAAPAVTTTTVVETSADTTAAPATAQLPSTR